MPLPPDRAAAVARPVFALVLALDALAGALSRLFFEACYQDPVGTPVAENARRWQRERLQIDMRYTDFAIALYTPDLVAADAVDDYRRRATGSLRRLDATSREAREATDRAAEALAAFAHYHPGYDFRNDGTTEDVMALHERYRVARGGLLDALELAGVEVPADVAGRCREVQPFGTLESMPTPEKLTAWIAESRAERDAPAPPGPDPGTDKQLAEMGRLLQSLAHHGQATLDQIIVAPGVTVDVTGLSCKVIPGRVPTACPDASPPLPPTMLTIAEKRMRELVPIPADRTIHWVGHDAGFRSKCRCHPGAPFAAPFDRARWSEMSVAAEGGAEKPVGPASSPMPSDADGLFDGTAVRLGGVVVQFGRAALQLRLVQALWDDSENQPSPARELESVLSEVYGENHQTEDSTFRQLCSDTRRRLATANCSFTILHEAGTVRLRRV